MRNRVRNLFICALVFGGFFTAQAQQNNGGAYSTVPRDIFEALASQREGEGDVTIQQPEALRKRVGSVSQIHFNALENPSQIVISQGFRIQVFNGNLPTSKQEAYRRTRLVNSALPGTMCYLTYKAPFWRLLVGDYTSINEARKDMLTLKQQLPSFASEIYIVRDKIRRIH